MPVFRRSVISLCVTCTFLSLGGLKVEAGAPPEHAIEELRQAIEDNPASLDAYLTHMELALTLKETEETEAFYRQNIAEGKSEKAKIALAYLYLKTGEQKKSKNLFRETLLSSSEESRQEVRELMQRIKKEAKNSVAENDNGKATKPPENLDSYFSYPRMAAEIGSLTEMEEAYLYLLKINPESMDTRLELAMFYIRQKRYEEAKYLLNIVAAHGNSAELKEQAINLLEPLNKVLAEDPEMKIPDFPAIAGAERGKKDFSGGRQYAASGPTFPGQFRGFIAVDGRGFLNGPLQPETQRYGSAPSLVLSPEYFYVSEDERNIFTFSPFLRLDAVDPKRSHADIRELTFLKQNGSWEAFFGSGKTFWGVAESNHLIDIINQVDQVEDIDGEDRLGQPMAQFALLSKMGNLRFFIMPYFRERTFPGVEGRLRSTLPVDTDNAVYESAIGERHVDFAARYENNFNEWDIGLSHFSGTSREPRLVVGTDEYGDAALIPHYDIIDQTSLDLQYTKDAWLWKFEGLVRNGHGERFNAMAGGFEYTIFNTLESDADIGFLAEYHRDDRGSEAPITNFDDDIFVGSRITLNDIEDTQFLAGMIMDRHTDEKFYNIETSRRIGDRWKVELEARLFSSSLDDNPIRQDEFVQFRIARFF